MKVLTLAACAVVIATSAHADFSYTTTQKVTGGSMAQFAGAAANRTTKMSLKGQKMKMDLGDISTILDFDAQTVTTVNNTQKTVSVKGFNDVAASAPKLDVKIDVKETGQKKSVNGFSASELIMTMDVDMSQASGGRGGMGKMQMEMDMWISPDPAGVSELRAFYTKNASRFPYSAMASGGSSQMASAMAEMQRKMAAMNGVPVEQIIRMKQAAGAAGAGMPGMPQMSGAQADQLAQARAKLEELAKGGGPAAAMAQQQLARMPGGAPAAGNSAPGVMMEMTMDSSDFSTSSIPDSVFAIPAGYQKTN